MAKKDLVAIMTYDELLELLHIIIHSKDILDAARLKVTAFTRNRCMPFSYALLFALDMLKTTLQTRLNSFFEKLGKGDPISQQALSKLRMNFDHSPFETMVRQFVAKEYSGQYDLPTWYGYHVYGIDGSSLQLPRVDELREAFGVMGRGGTCPCAGISVLYDVLHGWPLDPVIAGADMNERTECEDHIAFLCRSLPHLVEKSIILLDRGYPSLDLLGKLQDSGLKYLARCNSKFLSEINSAPEGDSVVTLKNGACIRIIKFKLPSGEIETLATNLFELSEELFPKLYGLRWGIETAYFKLKREICIEKFSGKTRNSILQDFWAGMVIMISVTVFQRAADEKVAERQKGKALKHTYRARTSDLIITLRDRFISAIICGPPEFTASEMDDVIKTMARVISPIRPGRSYPRKFKPAYVVNHNLKSHL